MPSFRVFIFLSILLPAPLRALSPASDARQQEGEKALFSLDYDDARARFHKLVDQEPENPYGYLLEAAGIWWQASNEYGLFEDTPTLEGLFETDINQALAKSKSMEKFAADKETLAEAHFIEGMALGARGQWNLLRGRWIRAYFDGKHAIKHLNKCLKLNPAFYDAYLGLGAYDYQAARLPAILRLSGLLLIRGDARRGLERLHLAYERGHYASLQAALFLINIYMTDAQDDAEALKLIDALLKKFPDSPYFLFLRTIALQHLHQFDGSYQSAQLIFHQVLADPTVLRRKQLSVFCGIYGKDCLSSDKVASALDWLERAIRAAGPSNSPWKTLLYFYAGAADDLLGQRGAALQNYSQALNLPDLAPVSSTRTVNNTEDMQARDPARPPNGANADDPPPLELHQWARRCIQAPCTIREVLGILTQHFRPDTQHFRP